MIETILEWLGWSVLVCLALSLLWIPLLIGLAVWGWCIKCKDSLLEKLKGGE